MTNQGDLQASIRTFTGTSNDYNGDWHALFDSAGIAAGDFNGRMIEWLQGQLSSSDTDLDGLKQAYAESLGLYNWNSIGALVLIPQNNLQLWLDANDPTTITEVAGAVSQWDDKSGTSNHATQSTGSRQPSTGVNTQNSLNVLTCVNGGFDLTNDIVATEMYVFAVVKGYGYHFAGDAISRIATTATDLIYWSQDGNAVINGATTNIKNGTSFQINRFALNTDSELYVNSSVDLTSTNNFTQTIDRIGLPWDNPTGIPYFNGDIAEILIYNNALTANEILEIETYLSNKWGIDI